MRRGLILLSSIVVWAGVYAAHAEDQAPAGDPAAGEKKFSICKTCHRIGEGAQNAIGPVLNGVVGRKAGTYPDYSYSEANKSSGLTWTEDNLRTYLRNPKGLVPGTKMTFAGFSRDSDINNVIAYLKTFAADGSRKP